MEDHSEACCPRCLSRPKNLKQYKRFCKAICITEFLEESRISYACYVPWSVDDIKGLYSKEGVYNG